MTDNSSASDESEHSAQIAEQTIPETSETTPENSSEITQSVEPVTMPEPKDVVQPLDLRPADGIPQPSLPILPDEQAVDTTPQTWLDRTKATLHETLANIVAFFEEGIFTIFWTRVPMTNKWQAALYGFSQSLFKWQPRLTPDCFNEGATYFNALIRLFVKFVKSGSLMGQEEFNFEDISVFFCQKCNLFDTLQGTILLNFLINRIDELPSQVRVYFGIPRFLLRLMDLDGFMNSIVEIGYIISLVMNRFSLVEDAKMLGKIIKLVVQFYFMDLFGNLL